MKINYKHLFDKELSLVNAMDKKPRLLLHACCAPCASAVLEALSSLFEITLFFYNPNISPEQEFNFRLSELSRLLGEMNLSDINIVAPKYDAAEFLSLAKGLESEPEGGSRCKECYYLRLAKSISYANEHGYDYVTTTLSISPYKNAQLLNEIGLKLCEGKTTKYLCSDFKKGDGYKRSCALSREFNLYRQNYCGCIFSKNNAQKA